MSAGRAQPGPVLVGGHQPAPQTRHLRRDAGPFRAALSEVHRVTLLPSTLSAAAIAGATRKLLIRPNEFVRAPSDLGEFDVETACSLISISKSQSTSTLNAKLGLTKNLGSDIDYYEALHGYYFQDRNVEYTEASAHPTIYSEWGYQIVFSGNVEFKDLPKELTFTLLKGKGYIFGIDGHSVYVTVKKNLAPGTVIASNPGVEEYLKFHSDNRNFNKLEHQRRVYYIYDKEHPAAWLGAAANPERRMSQRRPPSPARR